MYETTTTYGTSASDASVAIGFGAFFLILFMTLFFVAIIYVVSAIFLSMMFKKAGIEGWIAWVPVYNNWKLLEMGGQPGYWAVLSFVPILNLVALVFIILAYHEIGIRFGKDGLFVLIAIFVPIVWFIWLALDKTAIWQPKQHQGTMPSPSV